MKYIILCSNKEKYTFKYIDSIAVEVCNVYEYKVKNIFEKILRKIVYFIDFYGTKKYYGTWVEKIEDPDVQLIVFDECRPYFRLSRILRKCYRIPIIYFWNPIQKRNRINFLKKHFDVYTYSKEDSIKFELKFNQTFLPNYFFDFKNKDVIYTSVFIGQNKNRLKYLERLYTILPNSYFHIIKDGNEKSNIMKLKSKTEAISYSDYLKFIQKSGCIIEILPSNNAGFTLRSIESIVMQKKLITNNKKIIDYEIYKKGNIFIFDDNTSEKQLIDFIEQPFIEYSDEERLYFSFDNWLNRFEIEKR